MKLKYKKSQSSIYPELIDTTSSKTSVYLRKNIVEKVNSDDSETTYYEYDEAKLTKKEYEQYLQELSILDIEQMKADIDYLLIMADV